MVWGEGDQCVWVVTGGYWVRNGVCRVSEGTLEWYYTLGQSTSQWWAMEETDPAKTNNGQSRLYLDRAFDHWTYCPTDNCTQDTLHVYYSDQVGWVTSAQFVQMAGAAAQQAQQAQEQQQQQIRAQQAQIVQNQAPAQIQQQNGGRLAPISTEALLGITSQPWGHDFLAPNCSYDGCD